MLYPLVANFFVMGALMTLVYKPLPLVDLGGVGLIALLGFSGGVVLILAYRASEAAIVAPMQYSQIIWATLFGYLFFAKRSIWPLSWGRGSSSCRASISCSAKPAAAIRKTPRAAYTVTGLLGDVVPDFTVSAAWKTSVIWLLQIPARPYIPRSTVGA